KREKNRLIARVEVTNLVGHKFPSGVNFRRAFIEFQIKAGDKTLWASGATDKWGVIGNYTNGKFVPLNSEFFTRGEYQPHYETITREDQAQIYEELVTDSDGVITTSFFSLKTVIKDNRLLPHGWNLAGANGMKTVGVGDDNDYKNGQGS